MSYCRSHNHIYRVCLYLTRLIFLRVGTSYIIFVKYLLAINEVKDLGFLIFTNSCNYSYYDYSVISLHIIRYNAKIIPF